MLNPPSRFEENAEAQTSLLRPLAIFFVIASVLAASRMPAGRGGVARALCAACGLECAGACADALVCGLPPWSKGACGRFASCRAAMGLPKPRPAGGLRVLLVEQDSHCCGRSQCAGRRLRRSVALRNAHPLRESVVVRHPEPLARPVPGANSLVEATPGDVNPGEEARLSRSADVPAG